MHCWNFCAFLFRIQLMKFDFFSFIRSAKVFFFRWYERQMFDGWILLSRTECTPIRNAKEPFFRHAQNDSDGSNQKFVTKKPWVGFFMLTFFISFFFAYANDEVWSWNHAVNGNSPARPLIRRLRLATVLRFYFILKIPIKSK